MIVQAATTPIARGHNTMRGVWLEVGLPVTTPASAWTANAAPASKRVSFAARLIAAGVHDVMIGAGVEHMGRVPTGAIASHH